MTPTALEAGKPSSSWLLTGLSEPNFLQVQLTRAHSYVKPFSRLCKPSWIATNVGHLRDLDFLDSKIHTTEEDSKASAAKMSTDVPAPRKPWPKKRTKGKESGGGPAEEAAAN